MENIELILDESIRIYLAKEITQSRVMLMWRVDSALTLQHHKDSNILYEKRPEV